jgi:hypothetical protein
MLVPVGAAFGASRVAVAIPLTGTIEFRAILARTRKARTLLAAAVVARPVKARLVEILRTVTGRTGIALAAILALLPRLRIAAVPTTIGTVTKILSRAPIGRAARELLVAAKLSLRTIATGAIAITRRPLKGRSPRGRSPSLRKPSPRGVWGFLSPNFRSEKRPAGRASSRSLGSLWRSLGSLLRSRRGGRSSRLKFGRSPRGLNERFSPSSPRDGRPANGLSPRGRGASPKSRRGGRSSPSRLPA